jgi:hypothetical protein
MLKKALDRNPAAPQPEMVRVIPSNVQLERAEQNLRLAELRYDLVVRKGSAWKIDLPEAYVRK